jgi:hypothetical protein
VDAIKDTNLPLSPTAQEEIPDRQGDPFKALSRALNNGVIRNADDAFMLLPFSPDQIAAGAPDYYVYNAYRCPADKLISPRRSVGKLATMITGQVGKFASRYLGFYLTDMNYKKVNYEKVVEQVPRLLTAISHGRPGLVNVHLMRANETAARDIQRPANAPFTNSCDPNSGSLQQRHPELERPHGWYSVSWTNNHLLSGFDGSNSNDLAINTTMGVRFLGELKIPQI